MHAASAEVTLLHIVSRERAKEERETSGVGGMRAPSTEVRDGEPNSKPPAVAD